MRETTPATYRLYGRKNSGSFAVQVALEEIGVPYELSWVGSDAGEVAAFRKVNPTGRVPALTLPDGTSMFESAAILIHLALLHPEAALAPPPGSSAHAKFLQWMVFLSANVYEAALRIYYSDRYSERGAADAEAIRGRGTEDFLQFLGLISEELGPYVLGAGYSIADVYLYMLGSWYPDGKAALYERLPALGAHAEHLERRRALPKIDSEHAVSG